MARLHRDGKQQQSRLSRKTALCAVLVVTLTGLVLDAECSSGSSIFFRPSGVMQDPDGIRDIITAPGQQIDFRISLDVTAGPAARMLTGITYAVSWDPFELQLVERGITFDVDRQFANPPAAGFLPQTPASFPPPPIPDRNGGPNFMISHAGGAIAGGTTVQLDTLPFIVQPGLTNDGRIDFIISAVTPVGVALDAVNIPQQGFLAVSVQPPEPVPEPASLVLLGSGLAAILAARWRRASA